MKTLWSVAVLTALAMFVPGGISRAEDKEDGVALAIVFDTSGSMKDLVPDAGGGKAPKYVIAKKALARVADQMAAYQTNGPTPRKVYCALYVFSDATGREAIPFGPFDAKVLKDWAAHYANPSGGTPLGNALKRASERVLASPLSHKHVLILTDGLNTVGPDPAVVLPGLKAQAARGQTTLSVHFLAFDVAATQFSAVKRLGATVVGASDEKQLNTQLEFILKREILLEEEEPKK